MSVKDGVSRGKAKIVKGERRLYERATKRWRAKTTWKRSTLELGYKQIVIKSRNEKLLLKRNP